MIFPAKYRRIIQSDLCCHTCRTSSPHPPAPWRSSNFAREQRELSNSEIARLLELPESTCTDLLHTLLELGYFARTAQTRRFYPTAKLGEVLQRIEQNDPLLSAGTEAATLLAERTGETAFVGRLEVANVRVVAVQQGKHPLRYVTAAGERIALHTSAMGKALLAYCHGRSLAQASACRCARWSRAR